MKICIIVCWFGKFPDYFKLWEKSCSFNENYNFLLVTDQNYSSRVKNIKIVKMKLEELNNLINDKLGLNIKLIKPYKICDFRPAFGIIFKDYLKDYDFWGHCDIDQIFGKLDDFISNEMLEKYDRINKNGHFSLYRNCKIINNLFKSDNCKFYYKEVFNSSENYAFDEYTGINYIVNKEKIKEMDIKFFADISVKHKRYKIEQLKNYNVQSFVWNKGKIYRIYKFNNEIRSEEMMYLHFQKKIPNILLKNNQYDSLIIGSKYINEIDVNNIDEKIIVNCNPYLGFLFEEMEKIKYFIFKIKQFIKSSLKEKIIWIKQKL